MNRAEHKIPARAGKTIVITLDTSSRGYDLGALLSGQVVPSKSRLVFIQMQAESADCYYLFSPANNATVDETAAVSAGGALAYTANACDRIKQDTAQPFDIDMLVDRFLTVKGSAAGKLRISITSQTSSGDIL
jgi:hypothetical protein